jgi:pyrrolidone-carboxylate peptidase
MNMATLNNTLGSDAVLEINSSIKVPGGFLHCPFQASITRTSPNTNPSTADTAVSSVSVFVAEFQHNRNRKTNHRLVKLSA